jgi:hypothetical protein
MALFLFLLCCVVAQKIHMQVSRELGVSEDSEGAMIRKNC